MDKNLNKLKRDLRKLMRSQLLAVLSTQNQGQPYASLVAFASSDDLKSLYFATSRSTRKYANLSGDSRVAMLVDNRSNKTTDFLWAMAATATGTAVEVTPRERERALDRYLEKHPHLSDFVHSPSCAFCKIRVRTIFVVTHFQSTLEIHVRP